MDINELESFRLGDAVKFNSDLNPKIWDQNNKMRPEVQQRLLSIAQDFQDFLGLSDLQVKDITVSGSNAAYTYTDHSDIDLHLVVDMPDNYNNDVYRELFDAKKYQYNDQYDFRIGRYDVELYVQDADQPHVSRGIYSIKDDDWVRIPAKRQPSIDDISVRNKYQDVGARIESAIKSGDLARMDAIANKVGEMRRAGLADTGEFGPENLAFKVLRNNGTLDQLKQARLRAKSEQMSLAEQQKLMQEQQVVDMNVRYQSLQDAITQFAEHCYEKLNLQAPPRLIYRRDPAWSRRHGTFGRFDPDRHTVELSLANRHPMDIMRTLAHELAHAKQHEISDLPNNAGDTGSPWEDEAHAVAGQLMRGLAKKHPELFGDIPLGEGWKERVAGVATAACIAGTPGCATTQGATVGDALRGVQAVGRAANTVKQTGVAGARELAIQRAKDELRRRQGQVVPEDYDADHPPGPETPPTMPAGTVRVDVSDVYDWYKLGQHISNLKGLGQHDFGKGPPSTILSFGDENTEHKYIQDLEKTGLTTTDVDPVDPNQPPGMPRQKTDPTYNVDEDKQSVDEAQISKNIQPILMKKGYTFLGKGQDQDAYLAPDGTVLKIFGYGPGGNLSKGQQSFKDFADYCMANPSNPFLPQFGGWEPFDFEGKRYLQINCERMFDLGKSGSIMVGARLGQLSNLIEAFGADRGVRKFLKRHSDEETGKLVSLIGGRQQFMLLANTIERLANLANKKGYRLDLHAGNFMLGSDGEIVINDPFFTGNWRFDESINETFDQPYKLRWERGDHGDVDAYAKLPDGNYLSIMFNKGFMQDTKEEAWSVEFWRNNSQEVTGEGDAQRVFATVLSAIQKFIKKYKPNRITFSASKEVEPGQKSQSRARLYDTLVQRYARAWGFRAFRAETGNKVIYQLSRRQPVAEASGYIPVNDQEARDPRYSMAITQDIRPGEVQRQAAKMGFKTDAAGIPPLLMKLQNQLKEIKAK